MLVEYNPGEEQPTPEQQEVLDRLPRHLNFWFMLWESTDTMTIGYAGSLWFIDVAKDGTITQSNGMPVFSPFELDYLRGGQFLPQNW